MALNESEILEFCRSAIISQVFTLEKYGKVLKNKNAFFKKINSCEDKYELGEISKSFSAIIDNIHKERERNESRLNKNRNSSSYIKQVLKRKGIVNMVPELIELQKEILSLKRNLRK